MMTASTCTEIRLLYRLASSASKSFHWLSPSRSQDPTVPSALSNTDSAAPSLFGPEQVEIFNFNFFPSFSSLGQMCHYLTLPSFSRSACALLFFFTTSMMKPHMLVLSSPSEQSSLYQALCNLNLILKTQIFWTFLWALSLIIIVYTFHQLTWCTDALES